MAREPFTRHTARSFQGYSVANAAAVVHGLAARGCHCEPYADVFTFARWRAQGRTVRKGQHGIRLPVIVHGESTDKDTGETRTYSLRRASFVFCRCQTDTLGGAA